MGVIVQLPQPSMESDERCREVMTGLLQQEEELLALAREMEERTLSAERRSADLTKADPSG